MKDKDDHVTTHFLSGLNPVFSSARSVILVANKLSSLEDSFAQIRQASFDSVHIFAPPS